jgi:pyridoxamine 5'-phosphate oxidase
MNTRHDEAASPVSAAQPEAPVVTGDTGIDTLLHVAGQHLDATSTVTSIDPVEIIDRIFQEEHQPAEQKLVVVASTWANDATVNYGPRGEAAAFARGTANLAGASDVPAVAGPPAGGVATAIPEQPAETRTPCWGDSLTESDLAATWVEQLRLWLVDAVKAGLSEPNAMVLATADSQGRASSRTVLAKGLDERGLVFFTNYTSAKSHDLLATRYASVTFPWFGLRRQAHVRGSVEKVGPEETAQYWASRPRGSQLGAWASPQSRLVSDREVLDTALDSVERLFAGTDRVPVPEHWGGWRVRPEVVEFWQGRQDRMHDRIRFRLVRGTWTVERLAP